MLGDVIMTAGEGTEPLLSTLNGQRPQMQLRPLAMAVCKLVQPIPKVFGHQFGGGSKSPNFQSQHMNLMGRNISIWAVQLAEDGVTQEDNDNLRQMRARMLSEALRGLNRMWNQHISFA